ncbi:MAG TPA: TIGR01244 family sulfur transferase [Azospirillum sp.]|nr:TIGR01244 family sulfur transferase [Azospirillum sp.]
MPTLSQIADGVYAAGQLFDEDLAELARQGVKVIVNNRPDGEEPGQPTAGHAAEVAAKHGMAYHYIPVGREGPTAQAVDQMAAVLKEAQGPIVAHCRSGARSSNIYQMARARLAGAS